MKSESIDEEYERVKDIQRNIRKIKYTLERDIQDFYFWNERELFERVEKLKDIADFSMFQILHPFN
ncbi:hypothetical protein LEP1GSC059_0295 [Leptospira noguchii serovar Panama str. CZ214]|uniref:Uncharacterized protein n=1 Tax=Leptospira noguchii serovar Panama str. CZ214 TaxID=1001595 RepID=T0FVJ3_9LEPT|nr:hypothetical protein LEP1GSC059_0295 [Leptospira noguchii serovar Panama str. CZ214]